MSSMSCTTKKDFQQFPIAHESSFIPTVYSNVITINAFVPAAPCLAANLLCVAAMDLTAATHLPPATDIALAMSLT